MGNKAKHEKWIKALKRRADFLDGRIANYHGKDPSRDREEVAALRWAISVCETWMATAKTEWADDETRTRS